MVKTFVLLPENEENCYWKEYYLHNDGEIIVFIQFGIEILILITFVVGNNVYQARIF